MATVYLNGSLIDEHRARISPLDRGFLFGDALYEGIRAEAGVPVALDDHIQRLAAGLEESRIHAFDPGTLPSICRQLLDANDLHHAFIYFQVSRGAPPSEGPRRERVPSPEATPTLFAYAEPCAGLLDMPAPGERTAALVQDTRWTRGHVKGTSLLGNVIAAIEADERNADDAILHRDGLVTEGLATNVFCSIGDRVVTPSLDSAPMLAGVTRKLILEHHAADIDERPVTIEEFRTAGEIALVGTRTAVARVVSLDGDARHDAGLADRLLDTLKAAVRHGLHSTA